MAVSDLEKAFIDAIKADGGFASRVFIILAMQALQRGADKALWLKLCEKAWEKAERGKDLHRRAHSD